tara:strand:+ start:103 stop:552 length:450 start_codon:yes stop_codon:yes gene_type:complete
MKVIIYILILSFSFIAQAHKYEAENMLVDHPWMKVFNNNGAGYFKIKNIGDNDIHLLEVVSDSVDNIELHTIIMEEDVAKMRPVKGGVIIKVGESMEFKPMGNHLMFFGINQELGEGELMEAIFKFKNSRDLLVKFKMESNKSSHNHEH